MSGDSGKCYLALLHDKPLAVDTGETAHDGNPATEHERLFHLLGDLEVAAHLHRRARAMDPSVAGHIHADIARKKGKAHQPAVARLHPHRQLPPPGALGRTRP